MKDEDSWEQLRRRVQAKRVGDSLTPMQLDRLRQYIKGLSVEAAGGGVKEASVGENGS